jgi:hypothetical protein
MGRLYSVAFTGQTITTAGGDRDLFYVAPADDKPVVLHAVYLAQYSDVGDAAEEILRVDIVRGHTTVGSGGSSATPEPLDKIDTASGATARTNDTTIASAGAGVTVHADAFNIRGGWVYIPTPETRIRCSQSEGSLVVRLMAAPADDVSMSGVLYFEEI